MTVSNLALVRGSANLRACHANTLNCDKSTIDKTGQIETQVAIAPIAEVVASKLSSTIEQDKARPKSLKNHKVIKLKKVTLPSVQSLDKPIISELKANPSDKIKNAEPSQKPAIQKKSVKSKVCQILIRCLAVAIAVATVASTILLGHLFLPAALFGDFVYGVVLVAIAIIALFCGKADKIFQPAPPPVNWPL